MRKTAMTVLREHYPGLVRLAYLVLDDGRTPPGRLLAQARRVVREAARKAEPTHDGLRRAVAGRLLREPAPRRWTDRLRRRYAAAAGACGPVRRGLRELSVHERVAYVLCRVECLTAPEVGGALGDHLVVSAYDVDGTTARVDEATGLDAAAQRTELAAFDPTLVRLRPPAAYTTRWRLAAAAVVAVLLAAGLVGYRDWRRSGRPGDPMVVGDTAWRQVDFPALASWPTMGELRGDRRLLRRAAGAWRHRRDPPLGRVAVMFAGMVDDATYVIMHDTPGFRDAPMVAQYVEREQSRGVESVRRVRDDTGQFIVLTGTTRYLVPPWRTGLQASVLSGGGPRWQPVSVQDGVTEKLPWAWFDPDCQSVIVIKMTHLATGPPTPMTELASQVPEAPTPLVWFRDPDPGRGDNAFSGAPGQWAALRAIACEGAVTLSLSADLRVGRLWDGRLPAGGAPATLMTIDAARAAEGGTAVLISGEGRLLGGQGSTNGDYSTRSDRIVGAVWWLSQQAGRWYLVAAAGAEIVRMELVGELGRHESHHVPGGRLLILPGPPSRGAVPADGRPAVVQVIAYESLGTRLVIAP